MILHDIPHHLPQPLLIRAPRACHKPRRCNRITRRHLIPRLHQLQRMNESSRAHRSNPSPARDLNRSASLRHTSPDIPIRRPPQYIKRNITSNPHYIPAVESPKALFACNVLELVKELAFLTGTRDLEPSFQDFHWREENAACELGEASGECIVDGTIAEVGEERDLGGFARR